MFRCAIKFSYMHYLIFKMSPVKVCINHIICNIGNSIKTLKNIFSFIVCQFLENHKALEKQGKCKEDGQRHIKAYKQRLNSSFSFVFCCTHCLHKQF